MDKNLIYIQKEVSMILLYNILLDITETYFISDTIYMIW